MIKNETTLSSKGQLVIPQHIREELGLHAGDRLFIIASGKRLIIAPKPEDPLEALLALGRTFRFDPDALQRQRRIDRKIDEDHDRSRFNRHH
jgi:AbrB family looped-hinge helix DNA binding protein